MHEEQVIKRWSSFTYHGDNYSLDHLDEFEFTYVQEAAGDKPAILYRFLINFSLHCFTLKPNQRQGETLSDFPLDRHYSDSRETRIFCFSRYEMSFQLPTIAKEIGQRTCYNTGKGNFFTIEATTKEGQRIEYEVYFKVSKEGRGRLRLLIESAYIRDKDYGSSQPQKKKINFFIIARNIQMGKPIK